MAIVDAREDIKWNIDAIDALIRSNLVNLFEYDKYLAACMYNGTTSVIQFAMMLVKIYLIDDRSNAHIIESDLFGTIEVLSKIANHSRTPPEGLVQLVDMIKMASERIEHNLAMSGPTAQLHSGIQQARELHDPPGLLEKTECLLREWVNMYHSHAAGKDSTKAFTIFVQQMNLHGLLKTDDLITRCAWTCATAPWPSRTTAPPWSGPSVATLSTFSSASSPSSSNIPEINRSPSQW